MEDTKELGQMIRMEVDHFFDRMENVVGLLNDHQIKVLELLPDTERTKFLLDSQTNAIGLIETLMEKSFEVVNKVVDRQ